MALLGGLSDRFKSISFYDFGSQSKVCTTYFLKLDSILAQRSKEHLSELPSTNRVTQTRSRADRLKELLRLRRDREVGQEVDLQNLEEHYSLSG